jgi:biopolymer transport protein TolR
VDLDALRQRLQATAGRNPATELQLRADAAVPYGRMVQLIGLVQTAGLSRIGFVADAAPPAAR